MWLEFMPSLSTHAWVDKISRTIFPVTWEGFSTALTSLFAIQCLTWACNVHHCSSSQSGIVCFLILALIRHLCASQDNPLNHHSIVIRDEMVRIIHRNRDTLWKRPFHKQNPEPAARDAQTLQLFYSSLQVCNLGTTYLQLRVGLRSSYTDNNSPPDQDMTGNSTASVPTLPFFSDEEDIAGHTEPTGKILCLEVPSKAHTSSQSTA